MFDLLLNATRLLVSDDARKTASSLLEAIRRSPEWQHDICELFARIDGRFREQAVLVGSVATDKLRSLGYSTEAVDAFRTVFHELSSNAFEHGCTKITDDIRLTLSVTPAYVSLVVNNPRRSRPLNLDELLGKSASALKSTMLSPRGRGLLVVRELADSFEQADQRGLKAVIYRDRVGTISDSIGDLAIVFNFAGFTNPALVRRLHTVCDSYRDKHILLRFGWNDKPGRNTEVARAVIEIHGIQKSAGKKLIALYSRKADVFLPELLTARNWRDALEKIGCTHRLKEVEAAFERLHKRAEREHGRL